jgi:hypothetical protein
VDGHGLVGGERRDGLGIEVGGEVPQTVDLLIGEASHPLDHGALCEVDEPLDLNGDAVAVECRLGEVIDEVSGVFAVATIKRSEGDGGRDFGKGNSRHAPIFS